MDNTKCDLYRQRLQRIVDAVHLNIPDRIPISINCGYLAARYAGMTFEEAHYDCERWIAANKNIIMDLQPDIFGSFPQTPGPAYEAVDTKLIKWPGHGISSDATLQYIEGEYLKADEYDDYLNDPTDFAIRTYLPRTSGKLTAFQKLPPLMESINISRAGGPLSMLADEEVMAAFEAVFRAARETRKWGSAWRAFIREMEEAGFPAGYQPGGHAPFDYVSDYLRGMRGAMLDMYRQPDKLMEAIDKLTPVLIKMATSHVSKEPNPIVSIALHRGSDGFMSLKQFEKFYWPGVKALVLAFVEKGFIPSVFWEGDYTTRLEYLLELPEGKVNNLFDRTDIFRAKEVLGGHLCISGGMPASILQTGSIQDVEDRCRKLVDLAARDGGYILSSTCAMDNARLENVRAMIDYTRKHGVYA
ncbi:MAG: hypothetical protein JXA46_18140 [Dehalococcoidales bacterium]|nr:hypothetical protein [Dehalococcoidales bacterium]